MDRCAGRAVNLEGLTIPSYSIVSHEYLDRDYVVSLSMLLPHLALPGVSIALGLGLGLESPLLHLDHS